MKGDLHVHTNNSDGSQSASFVITLAKRIGLDYIAITDHDYMSYTDELYQLAQEQGIRLIDGVELSSVDKNTGRRVHILCYLPKNRQMINDLCKQTTALRVNAGLGMAEKVAKLYPVTVDDIRKTAVNSPCIYKQHISKALMNIGLSTVVFSSLYDELFDFHTGSCIINFPQPNVYDVIETVKSAGGVAVMAHPYTYNSIDLLRKLAEDKLIDGVEVYSSKSTPEQEKTLLELATANGLIITGGSDFHGAFSSRISPLGSRYTPEQSIKSILNFNIKDGKLHWI